MLTNGLEAELPPIDYMPPQSTCFRLCISLGSWFKPGESYIIKASYFHTYRAVGENPSIASFLCKSGGFWPRATESSVLTLSCDENQCKAITRTRQPLMERGSTPIEILAAVDGEMSVCWTKGVICSRCWFFCTSEGRGWETRGHFGWNSTSIMTSLHNDHYIKYFKRP